MSSKTSKKLLKRYDFYTTLFFISLYLLLNRKNYRRIQVAFADPNEIFFTPFEPKLKNRFIMEIDGIPAYLVKTMARPSIAFDTVTLDHINVKRYVKGKAQWQPIEVTLYDPIVPSGAQAVNEWIRLHHESVTGVDGYSSEYKKDITFNLLSPNGEKIEQWIIKGAFLTAANFNDLDFASNDVVEIGLTMQYDYAILEF
tara:strand:+ start:87 stop:683 length:597 start_codon:yes stop_codon:yes gene_type:complete